MAKSPGRTIKKYLFLSALGPQRTFPVGRLGAYQAASSLAFQVPPLALVDQGLPRTACALSLKCKF